MEPTKKIKFIKAFILNLVSVFLIAVRVCAATLTINGLVTGIPNVKGMPTPWSNLTSKASMIDIPVTYWDQKGDLVDTDITDITTYNDPRLEELQIQFEFNDFATRNTAMKDKIWAALTQGLVKDTLGSDGTPVPTHSVAYTTAEHNSGDKVDTSKWVIGDTTGATKTGNFYRWFHEVAGKSKEITGKTISLVYDSYNNVYKYGSTTGNTFPLDSEEDNYFQETLLSNNQNPHNFHFTMQASMDFIAKGGEKFKFVGDDDVWIFMNGHLVVDLGGVHEKLTGYFQINDNMTLTSIIEKNTSEGAQVANDIIKNYSAAELGLGLNKPVRLDFFYAERNTNLADFYIETTIIPTIELDITKSARINEAGDGTVYTATVTNPNAEAVYIHGLSDWMNSGKEYSTDGGFLNLLNSDVVSGLSYYIDESRQGEITDLIAPGTAGNSFFLPTPILLNPNETIQFNFTVTGSYGAVYDVFAVVGSTAASLVLNGSTGSGSGSGSGDASNGSGDASNGTGDASNGTGDAGGTGDASNGTGDAGTGAGAGTVLSGAWGRSLAFETPAEPEYESEFYESEPIDIPTTGGNFTKDVAWLVTPSAMAGLGILGLKSKNKYKI
ncbi:MAG: fibro-slime domain-containing protein [Candidatus Improbicoccus devescovinae]|nr:MAG: fibro-slime domain-containing protein [Candidatus Improbicoccus devescovinae]